MCDFKTTRSGAPTSNFSHAQQLQPLDTPSNYFFPGLQQIERNITAQPPKNRLGALIQCTHAVWSRTNLTRSYPSNVQMERSQEGEKYYGTLPKNGPKKLSKPQCKTPKIYYGTLNLNFSKPPKKLKKPRKVEKERVKRVVIYPSKPTLLVNQGAPKCYGSVSACRNISCAVHMVSYSRTQQILRHGPF
jgi:hypothetical protein